MLRKVDLLVYLSYFYKTIVCRSITLKIVKLTTSISRFIFPLEEYDILIHFRNGEKPRKH
jgi:hypothetical protein